VKIILMFVILFTAHPAYTWLENVPQVDAMAWRSLISGGRYFISKHVLKNEPVYILTAVGPDDSRPYRIISRSMYKTYTKEILNLTKGYRYPDPKIFSCEKHFIIEVKLPNLKPQSRAFCMAGFNKTTSKKIVAWERTLDRWFR